jgi:NitT/TauT family transport system ATP-binding protein
MSSNILVELKNISKTFQSDWGSVEALQRISFSCREREFISIVGASGCGKTTLLRIIAGLESPSSGEAFFNGEKIDGPGYDRAVVFQDPRLFPWLTVERNISLPIEGRKDSQKIEQIVDQTLRLVEMSNFRKAYPYELSGGMAQRVAIARALAFEPKALLMDEPFSALDAQTRSRLPLELIDLWCKTDRTIIMVTHDIEEALILSQKVIIMTPAPGTIKEILKVPLAYPRNKDTLDFIELRKYILKSIL